MLTERQTILHMSCLRILCGLVSFPTSRASNLGWSYPGTEAPCLMRSYNHTLQTLIWRYFDQRIRTPLLVQPRLRPFILSCFSLSGVQNTSETIISQPYDPFAQRCATTIRRPATCVNVGSVLIVVKLINARLHPAANCISNHGEASTHKEIH